MAKLSKVEPSIRTSLSLPASLMDKVRTYQQANNFRSTADALRQLVRNGLQSGLTFVPTEKT